MNSQAETEELSHRQKAPTKKALRRDNGGASNRFGLRQIRKISMVKETSEIVIRWTDIALAKLQRQRKTARRELWGDESMHHLRFETWPKPHAANESDGC
jgi:hypothetical protein